jgi:hypothetical protein
VPINKKEICVRRLNEVEGKNTVTESGSSSMKSVSN